MAIETGGEHQHVELVQLAVAGAHAAGLDAFDAGGDQGGVRPLDRLVERIRHDQALARHLVIGRQPTAQFRVTHVVLEVHAAALLDARHLRLVADHRAREGVIELVGHAPEHVLELFRVGAEFGLLRLAVDLVGIG